MEIGRLAVSEKIAKRLEEALDVGYRYILYGYEEDRDFPLNQDMIIF